MLEARGITYAHPGAREPLYREVARHTVSSSAEPVSHVVRAVLDELGFTDIQVNTGAAE